MPRPKNGYPLAMQIDNATANVDFPTFGLATNRERFRTGKTSSQIQRVGSGGSARASLADNNSGQNSGCCEGGLVPFRLASSASAIFRSVNHHATKIFSAPWTEPNAISFSNCFMWTLISSDVNVEKSGWGVRNSSGMIGPQSFLQEGSDSVILLIVAGSRIDDWGLV